MNAEGRFEALYEAHYRHVLAYARRRVEEHTARDLTAETFAIAWRRFEAVPLEEPLAWLYATARRVLANELRNERYRRRLTLRAQAAVMAGIPAVVDHAEEVVLRDELAQAMARLSPRDQEALQLSSWEDLDPATAAAVTGCSTTAFKVRLHRARRRMRDVLRHTNDSQTSQKPDRELSRPRLLGTQVGALPPPSQTAAPPDAQPPAITAPFGEHPRPHSLEDHR